MPDPIQTKSGREQHVCMYILAQLHAAGKKKKRCIYITILINLYLKIYPLNTRHLWINIFLVGSHLHTTSSQLRLSTLLITRLRGPCRCRSSLGTDIDKDPRYYLFRYLTTYTCRHLVKLWSRQRRFNLFLPPLKHPPTSTGVIYSYSSETLHLVSLLLHVEILYIGVLYNT